MKFSGTFSRLLFVICTICLLGGSAIAQDAAEVATNDPAAKSTFDIIFSGGIFGVGMIILLFVLSLIAAYLVFDHISTAKQNCNDNPSLLSFVLMHGISELEFGWSSVEKAIEDALAEQSARLFRKIEYLSVIGNIAPMVGLLGTVFGMIVATKRWSRRSAV